MSTPTFLEFRANISRKNFSNVYYVHLPFNEYRISSYVCARVAVSFTVKTKRWRLSFSLYTAKERREEERDARPVSQASETCRNGSARDYVRQRQTTAWSRVQTPRHFVHPWIICGAMPNASTAARRAFQYACARRVQLHPARARVHPHPKNTDQQTRAAPGYSLSRSDDNNTRFSGSKSVLLHAVFPFSYLFRTISIFENAIAARKFNFFLKGRTHVIHVARAVSDAKPQSRHMFRERPNVWQCKLFVS